RLDHLDRHDVVEPAGDLAVVLQPYVGAAIEAGIGVSLLRRRDGDCRHPVATVCRSFGETAPAAADFQKAFTPCEPRQDAVVLARLRTLQIVAGPEQRRGIGQAGVEPELVELVSDIVMGADVALRSAP